EVVRSLQERWARMGRRGPIPESNFTQAMIPEGAVIIPNAHGSAPGIWLEDDRGRWVAMLPGVPREMRAMLSEGLLPKVTEQLGEHDAETVVMSWTIRTT